MASRLKRNFSPEYRPEAAQLVVNQNYPVQEAAEAISVGHSTMENGFVSYAKNIMGKALKQRL